MYNLSKPNSNINNKNNVQQARKQASNKQPQTNRSVNRLVNRSSFRQMHGDIADKSESNLPYLNRKEKRMAAGFDTRTTDCTFENQTTV